jgi:fructose-1,6-bisphosphatase/inositol monophosphatase family enzyme
VTGEIFFAIKGTGSYLNDWTNPLHVSETETIEESLIHIEFPNKNMIPEFQCDFEKQCESVKMIFSKAYRIRGFGIGSLGLAYVAKGAFDAYITLTGTTLRYDVDAGMLLVEEAGGMVEKYDAPAVVENNIRVMAANRKIFQEIKSVVKL